MSVHVAVVLPVYAAAIRAGSKRVEARLNKTRRAPFGAVARGEELYFKARGGRFFAIAFVTGVVEEVLTGPADVERIRLHYGERLGAEQAYWDKKHDAKYATLIEFGSVAPIEFGPDMAGIPLAARRNAWHVLPDEASVYPGCLSRAERSPEV